MKGWSGLAIGVLFSAFTLWLALRGNDLSQIGNALSTANWSVVVPTAFFFGIGLVFRGFRWRVLLSDRLSTLHSLNIMNIGYFLGVVLPFRLGEVARAFLTTRLDPPIPILTSIGSIVAERLIDLLSVAVMIALAVSLAPVPSSISTVAISSGILTVLGLIVLVFLSARRQIAYTILNFFLKLLPFLNRLNPRVLMDRVLDGLAPLGSLSGVTRLLVWNVLAWGSSVAAGFILLSMFFPEPSLFATLLIICSASLAVALPAVPGNVGPFEAAVIGALGISGLVDLGVPDQSARAFAYALVLHIFNVLSYIVGGLLGLRAENISLGDLIRQVRRGQGNEPKQEANPALIVTTDAKNGVPTKMP